MPGYGSSDIVEDLSIEYMAFLLKHLLELLKLAKICIIGHSLGGYVATCFAELFEQTNCGLGLFHLTARADDEEVKNNRNRTIEIIKADKNNTFINLFYKDLFYKENVEKFEKEIETIQKRAYNISKTALIETQQAMAKRKDYLGFISETKIPILFIVGKEDKRININSILAQAVLAKQSYILLLSECGHVGFVEKPNECIASIKGFLNACFN